MRLEVRFVGGGRRHDRLGAVYVPRRRPVGRDTWDRRDCSVHVPTPTSTGLSGVSHPRRQAEIQSPKPATAVRLDMSDLLVSPKQTQGIRIIKCVGCWCRLSSPTALGIAGVQLGMECQACNFGQVTLRDRALLEGLMVGLDVPPSGARRPAWMADGACIEHPEIEFIPPSSRTEANADAARAVCRGCLCRAECAAYAYALADDGLVGIWAGTTTAERRAMCRQWAVA